MKFAHRTIALRAALLLAFLACSCTPSARWADAGLKTYYPPHQQPRPVPVFPVVNPVPLQERAAGFWQGAVEGIRPEPKPVFRPPVVHYASSRTASPQLPRGKVRLVNGRAVAPPDAPLVVRQAVEAGNRLQRYPYKWGGGHAVLNDTGYDCSGAVSYVLREAGLMADQRPSRGFLTYGQAGEGDWITVWAKEGHVFMTVGGLRLDTGGSSRRTGPRWKEASRSYRGFIARHPRGY